MNLRYNELEDTLRYDPETGQLFRIRELKTTRERDEERYTTITVWVKGSQKPATHVIFWIMTGRWPNPGMVIDHIDGNPFNNEWSNLREATHAQNAQNRGSPGRWKNQNEQLETCVRRQGNRYQVRISSVTYGYFSTAAEANEVARRKRAELHGVYRPNSDKLRRI